MTLARVIRLGLVGLVAACTAAPAPRPGATDVVARLVVDAVATAEGHTDTQPDDSTSPARGGVRDVPSTEVGPLCGLESAASLPDGTVPVTSRQANPPKHNGYLALTGAPPRLLDSTTGADVGPIMLSSEGQLVPPGIEFTWLQWSPDGRWLSYRPDAGCLPEVIVSSDRRRGVNVTRYPEGTWAADAAWSPDGRWLAVDVDVYDGRTFVESRIDTFGISIDGQVTDGRTVWRSDDPSLLLGGVVWGSAGSISFSLVARDPGARAGVDVLFLAPGASTPSRVDTEADGMGPLTWLSDGSAVVAVGTVAGRTELFRIGPGGSSIVPLSGVLIGPEAEHQPVAILDGRIVLLAYHDDGADRAFYSLRPDGSDLARFDLRDLAPDAELTFVAAPDGHHIAVSNGLRIWVLDTADGTERRLTVGDRDLLARQPMAWQPIE
jgi:hypothetical protein